MVAQILEIGRDPAVDGVVRWRRINLQKAIKERFGVDYHKRYVATLLKERGFFQKSARPHHRAQDGEKISHAR
ncbi:MAG: winged helix-turn-helix domain-containing protein [Mesorhizobium sp.]|nr:MAG: winged helix-turn-helix domain-containing protein [Mesorhizobium sp.]TIL70401.1 MAG: winged helix-turn-helix domain-containing protein [Mesorhizobium sp.]